MSDLLPTQVEQERRALALLARADVRAAVRRASELWRSGTPGVTAETYAALPSAIEEVALLVALQVVADDPARPRFVEISAGPHSWEGITVPGGRWGINNPDTLYFAAAIDPRSSYAVRIRPPSSGRVPTDVNISVQIRDVWHVLANLGRSEILGGSSVVQEVGDGYTIRVGGPAATLPIDERGTVLLVRQTLADWAEELPCALEIERTGGPPPASPRSDDDLARDLADRLHAVVMHNVETLQAPVLARPVSVIPSPGAPGDKSGFLTAQRSTLGHFRLQDDEALIVEVAAGAAGDPGVEGWVDPGGLRAGIVMVRWQLLDAHPEVADEPDAVARTVRLDDLATVPNPPAGLRPIDDAARARRDTRRRAAYQRRFELR